MSTREIILWVVADVLVALASTALLYYCFSLLIP